jgi:DNA-binding HxlR family transcriptional regulator
MRAALHWEEGTRVEYALTEARRMLCEPLRALKE